MIHGTDSGPVSDYIANYKVPRQHIDAPPLSGARKVLKRELRRKYWESSARHVH